MAKDDPPAGLLSKVARFVANPTKGWDELEAKDSEPSTGYSKDVLKAMIVRKKQNDFVRKREFDVLRKLRRTDPAQNTAKAEDRPSYFQSSLPSNADDRAMTVRKIDEIEAQMSNQWWRGKGNDAAAEGRPTAPPPRLQDVHSRPSSVAPSSPPSPSAPTAQATSPRRPQSQSLDLKVNKAIPAPAPLNKPRPEQTYKQSAETAHAPLIPATAAPNAKPNSGVIEPPLQWGKANSAATDMGGLGTDFSISNLFQNVEIDVASEPELEEAAIRFANGDTAGAEEALVAALKPADLTPQRAEIWVAALFDLYRATGQQAKFEEGALEFASRFGRSAPAWFSTPDLLKQLETVPASKGGATQIAVSYSAAHWIAPEALTPTSLAALQLVLKNKAAPWLLDWSTLSEIAPEVVTELGALFNHWCVTPVTLTFRGAQGLIETLKRLTIVGEATVPPAAWQMHMDALRVMGMHEEFETVALDFCVTFEVSPPSWQKSLCICKLEGAEGTQESASKQSNLEVKEPWKDSIVHSSFLGEDSVIGMPMVALSGEILSDAADALAELESGIGEGATQMVVSCENLIRVDFSAAGSILNWVAGQRASGCMVQFRNVNRIVAAFFHVIGITEFARVVPRNT
jgi:ABC-type transporter Mla MlaB component